MPAVPAGPVKLSRKAAPAEPARPVVRRVARVAEPPLIPVEPAAPEPEPEPMGETLPVPYVARTEEPRRGIFRRMLDRCAATTTTRPTTRTPAAWKSCPRTRPSSSPTRAR